MWDMVEYHFLMLGKRLDFLAADGFRFKYPDLTSALGTLVTPFTR